MVCTNFFKSCLNTFVLARCISCIIETATYTIYDVYITSLKSTFKRSNNSSPEAFSAFTKNNSLSNKITSPAYLTVMDHWSSQEISCVVFIYTENTAASLISLAMDFWIKSCIITINVETMVLLQNVTSDPLPLILFKCASLLFITILSKGFVGMKSNFEMSYIISRKFSWFKLLSQKLCKASFFFPLK